MRDVRYWSAFLQQSPGHDLGLPVHSVAHRKPIPMTISRNAQICDAACVDAGSLAGNGSWSGSKPRAGKDPDTSRPSFFGRCMANAGDWHSNSGERGTKVTCWPR